MSTLSPPCSEATLRWSARITVSPPIVPAALLHPDSTIGVVVAVVVVVVVVVVVAVVPSLI